MFRQFNSVFVFEVTIEKENKGSATCNNQFLHNLWGKKADATEEWYTKDNKNIAKKKKTYIY